jgi:hypothetical protein
VHRALELTGETLQPPLILLGMHRSGTTILAQALATLGLYQGRLGGHHESRLFFDLNEAILSWAHATWDHPTPVERLFRDADVLQAAADLLREHMRQRFPSEFLGSDHAGGNIAHWGWKDPRNTLTWPLWQALFPSARYVYLVRNGADVALSLREREDARRTRLGYPPHSLRCQTLAESFEVWEEYCRVYAAHRRRYPDARVLEIRFEDLVTGPEPALHRILEFAAMPRDAERIRATAAMFRPASANRYLSNPEAQALYHSVQHRAAMTGAGYSDLSPMALKVRAARSIVSGALKTLCRSIRDDFGDH